MNLYNISENYLSILSHFEENEGEVGQEDIRLLKELDNLHDDIQTKAINVAAFIKNTEAEYNEVYLARKAMQARENNLKDKMSWLESYLKMNLERCGITEITKSPQFVIKIKKCPFSVNVIDEEKIPIEYKQVKEVISIDKNKLKQDLQQGVAVEGAELLQNLRLEIK